MREAGVNLVSLGIFSWVLMEPAAGAYELRLARRDRRPAARATGSRWTWRPRPPRRPRGSRRRYPASLPVTRDRHADRRRRPADCLPELARVPRGHGARSPRALGRALPRATPRVVMWHVHNEYGGAARRSATATPASAAFREWLRRRYGDLAALNEAWGTTFWGQRYGDWEEIDAPRASHTAVNPAQRLDFARFTSDEHLACFRLQRDVLRRAHPGPAGHHELHGHQLQVDGLLAVGGRGGRRRQRPLPRRRAARQPHRARHVGRPEPVARRRPPVDAHGALDRRGQLAAPQHRQAARRDAPQQPRPRRPRLGLGAVLPVAGLPVRRGEVPLGDAAARGHRLPDVARRRRPRRGPAPDSPRCAAAGSRPRWRSCGTGSRAGRWSWSGGPRSTCVFRERMDAYYEALWREHVTVDFVHPTADLSGYRLVVAPSAVPAHRGRGEEPAPLRRGRRPPVRVVLLRHRRRERHDPRRAAPGRAARGARAHRRGVPPAARRRDRRPAPAATAAASGPSGYGLAGAEAVLRFADGPDAGHPAFTCHGWAPGAPGTWRPRRGTCGRCSPGRSTPRAWTGRAACRRPWSTCAAAATSSSSTTPTARSRCPG